MKEKWIGFFPYSKPRPQQVEAIDRIISAWESGKRFAIVEAGTGVGKSAIGITIAKYITSNSIPKEGFESGAHFLTTQKILQDQYMSDFKQHGMLSIKSSANYGCRYHKKIHVQKVLELLEMQKRDQHFGTHALLTALIRKLRKIMLMENLA